MDVVVIVRVVDVVVILRVVDVVVMLDLSIAFYRFEYDILL